MQKTAWLQKLAENEAARRRLEEILNHTETDEDGEGLLFAADHAAEVYTILFHAFTDPDGTLVDLMARAVDEKTSVITRTEYVTDISEPGDDEPGYADVTEPVDAIGVRWT